MSRRSSGIGSLGLAAILAPAILAGCQGGAPDTALSLSVVNRGPFTVTVGIEGPAPNPNTIKVHSCSGSGVFLAHGDYRLTILTGAKPGSVDIAVPIDTIRGASQVILIKPDLSVDWESTADPNKKAC